VIGDEAGGNGYKKRVDRMGRMGSGWGLVEDSEYDVFRVRVSREWC
jgi:hypothetical protein